MVLNPPVVPGLAALGDLQQKAMTESVNTGLMVPVIRLQSDHQQEYAVGIDPLPTFSTSNPMPESSHTIYPRHLIWLHSPAAA